MTSVRNRPLRLSGNSYIFGLAFLLLVVGCTPKVRVLRPAGSNVEPKTETPEEKGKEDVAPIEAEKINVKDIALLLPFQLDKANQHAPSTADIRRSALALDFYQGFKLGLDALAASGVHFKVNVLDTRDDVNENARIAKLNEVQDAALIVGPIYPKEIRVFGFNASLDHALQISPLAASMPSEFNFPNLVTITAPISAHIKALAAHIAKQYRTGDVVLLYDTRDATSQQFLGPLRREIQQQHKNITVAAVNDEESLASRVRLSGKNLVVLGTTNKYEISPILAHLHTLRNELSYQIQLFGHPNWAKVDFDEEDELSAFKTCITTSYYIDSRASAVRKFDQQYQQEFGIAPTEFAYKGYDAAYYFGSLLAKYGEEYKDYVVKEEYDGLHNTFKFEYDPEWGYVNNHISILQFVSGDFQPIN